MALAIDASTPGVKTNGLNASNSAITSSFFAPPANSLLVIMYSSDGGNPEAAPTPTITDSLGSHLTYTLQVKSNANTTARNGQATIWTAPATGAGMTVTITNTSTLQPCASVLYIVVLTDSNGGTPVPGAITSGAVTGTSSAMTYTATGTGSWGFGVSEPWAAGTAFTAGTGTTALASGSTPATLTTGSTIDYGFFRRTTADGVSGSGTTVNATYSPTQTQGNYAAIEILAGVVASAAGPPQRQAVPGRTWKRRFQHPQAKQPDPPQATPVAPNFVPSAMVPRRVVRRIPVPGWRSGTDIIDGNQLLPPSLKRSPRARRKPPFPSSAGGDFAPPVGLGRPPLARRRPALNPYIRIDGDSFEPPFDTTTPPPVNPAITATGTGRFRVTGRRQPRPTVTAPVPPQVNPPIVPEVLRAFRRAVTLRRATLRVPAPDQGMGPVAGTMRRATPARVARRRVSTLTPPTGADTTQSGVFGPRLRRVVTLRRGKTFTPPAASSAVVPNPSITQTTDVRGRVTARATRRPQVAQWTPAQQTATPNPTITGLVFGRLRTVGRRQPRPAVSTPVPAQQTAPTNPKITQTVTGRFRVVGRVQPRAKVPAPIPGQAAPIQAARVRVTLRVRRSGQAATPVPTQQAATPNPGITATVFGRLRTVGRVQPRPKVANPVSPQQAVVPNPPVTVTVFGRLRTVGRVQPRPHVVKPVPGQVNPPFVSQGGRGRPLRGLARPSWHNRTPVPLQDGTGTHTPGVRPRLLRAVAKLIPRRIGRVFDRITTLGGPVQVTDSTGTVTSTEASVSSVEGVETSTSGVGGVYGAISTVTSTEDGNPTVGGAYGGNDQVQQ